MTSETIGLAGLLLTTLVIWGRLEHRLTKVETQLDLMHKYLLKNK